MLFLTSFVVLSILVLKITQLITSKLLHLHMRNRIHNLWIRSVSHSQVPSETIPIDTPANSNAELMTRDSFHAQLLPLHRLLFFSPRHTQYHRRRCDVQLFFFNWTLNFLQKISLLSWRIVLVASSFLSRPLIQWIYFSTFFILSITSTAMFKAPSQPKTKVFPSHEIDFFLLYVSPSLSRSFTHLS